ncbi:MAG: tandem-95 repeat protein [Magnetococcales bacterium]|nr:tandem-95 repeat protein [Magnetococcales bacterium]
MNIFKNSLWLSCGLFLMTVGNQLQAAAPTVMNPIQDQTWTGSGVKSFQVPANTFRDVDQDLLTYTASMADGTAWPSWLRFVAATRTFSGNPPVGVIRLPLRVTASDGRGGRVSSRFNLNLVNVNDRPVVRQQLTSQVWSGSGIKSFQIPTELFRDGDGDRLTHSVRMADGSTWPSWLRFSAATRMLSGNPPSGTRTLALKVQVSDGHGATASTVFDLVTRAGNDLPVVTTPLASQTWNGSGVQSFQIPVATFSDADGDRLSYTVKQANGSALPTWLSYASSTRTLSGNPSAGLTALNLLVTATDGKGGTATTPLTLNFGSATNDAPVAVNDSLTVSGSNPVADTLTATDADRDVLTYLIVGQPASGRVTLTNSAAGTYTYTANAGAVGTDRFTFKVNDGRQDSNVATVTVTVSNANSIPVANNGTLTIRQGAVARGTLSASDADGNGLIYSIVANGTKGRAELTDPATGAYTYTPNATSIGNDTFTFKVNDGVTDSTTATMTVTITSPTSLPATGVRVSLNSGDDGALRKGEVWPVPRFTDHGNGAVTDHLTGLVWLKQADCLGTAASLTAAVNLVGALEGNGGQCGLQDRSQRGAWRVPNRVELESLVDYSRIGPALPENHPFLGFPLNTTRIFWSNTAQFNGSSICWAVDFRLGSQDRSANSSSLVWAVRDGTATGRVALRQTGQTRSVVTGDDGNLRKGVAWTSDSRFVDRQDGTIMDQLTGLVWLKNMFRCPDNTELSGSVTRVLERAAGLQQGVCGLTDGSRAGDWRVANIREAASLQDIDQTDGGSAWASPLFNGSWIGWTSTPVANDPLRYWTAVFTAAYVENQEISRNGSPVVYMGFYVRDERP